MFLNKEANFFRKSLPGVALSRRGMFSISLNNKEQPTMFKISDTEFVTFVNIDNGSSAYY